MDTGAGLPRDVDATRANDARLCDFALGGKDNFAADRTAALKLADALEETRYLLSEWHRFRVRALETLLDAGVRQFLELGCGMPVRNNVHDIVHARDPQAPVVYVDIDAVAVTHFLALLSSKATAATAVQADIRDPAGVLGHPEIAARLDFDRPIGVLLIAVLHLIGDEEDPNRIIAGYREAMAPGSHLVYSDLSGEEQPADQVATYVRIGEEVGIPVTMRGRTRTSQFFDGFDLLEPGLVSPPDWRPSGVSRPHTRWLLGAVGRKP
ncbi:SAM-dependent methyltransferase [Actinomadura chokoriensis]|uniref:SAM-dependent methyltransferase n=1 Tax=Actinomadura chokoriensis TaxID=454156 RepID=UPI0031F9F31E